MKCTEVHGTASLNLTAHLLLAPQEQPGTHKSNPAGTLQVTNSCSGSYRQTSVQGRPSWLPFVSCAQQLQSKDKHCPQRKTNADTWGCFTVAWFKTMTWIPLPCSRASSSRTCKRRSNENHVPVSLIPCPFSTAVTPNKGQVSFL